MTRRIERVELGAAPASTSSRCRTAAPQLRAERELELAAAELAATLESTADGILVTDLAGRIRHCNRRFADLWGLPEDLLLSREDDAVLDWMRRSVTDPATYMRRLAAVEEATMLQASDVLELHSGKVIERITLPQCSRGRPIGRVFSFRDITDRSSPRSASRSCRTPTRSPACPTAACWPNASSARWRWRSAKARPLRLLLLNLDHFKQINDTLGHAFGDRVLVEVSERLTAGVRQIDTVARLGADEFVLLAQRSDAAGAEAAARRVMEALQRPFTLDGMSFTVTASLGIALHPADGVGHGRPAAAAPTRRCARSSRPAAPATVSTPSAATPAMPTCARACSSTMRCARRWRSSASACTTSRRSISPAAR